jgi:hypothetical protein
MYIGRRIRVVNATLYDYSGPSKTGAFRIGGTLVRRPVLVTPELAHIKVITVLPINVTDCRETIGKEPVGGIAPFYSFLLVPLKIYEPKER